jgi:hypothetical protein
MEHSGNIGSKKTSSGNMLGMKWENPTRIEKASSGNTLGK